MNDSFTAVSRRSVLVSGLALSVLSVPVAAASRGDVSARVLSGRVTDAQGLPLRQAQVAVGEAVTRTDGDGRFFMQVQLPALATVPLRITRQGETQAVDMRAAVEHTDVSAHPNASVSLVMAA